MKPIAPHGTRSRYFYRGCRCLKCKSANALYQQRRRKSDWHGLVWASPARRHIMKLREQHVGSRVIQEVTGIDRRTCYMITSRRHKKIQWRTSDLILSVHPDARADKSLVDAGPTWRILQFFLDEGLTKTELARRLGSTAITPMLQIGKVKCTAKNAMMVARFYNRMRLGGDD